MRTCHVVYSYFPFDPRVRREVETLQRAGHAVDVISLRGHGQSREETVLGIRVHRIGLTAVRGGMARYAYQYFAFVLSATWLLLRLHSKDRFDIIHIHSLPDFLVFAAIPEKILGVPLVLDLHEAMPEIFEARFPSRRDGLVHGVLKGLEWTSCAIADEVLVVSEPIRELLEKRGTDPGKLTVVMNSPSNVDRVATVPTSKNTRPASGGPAAIVYVGGINAERDLGVLVRAAAILRRSHSLKLVIRGYGEEPYQHALVSEAEAAGFGQDFAIGAAVPQEDVIPLLEQSDIGTVTYERNPLTELAVPNKVFEYVAAGCPLVIADLRALHCLFGNAALYYRPGDPEDLAEKMDYILRHPDIAAELTVRARQVAARCDWAVMSQRLRDIYDRCSNVHGGSF